MFFEIANEIFPIYIYSCHGESEVIKFPKFCNESPARGYFILNILLKSVVLKLNFRFRHWVCMRSL